MALTSAEQNKIVQLLGYGGKILQPGSVIYNKTLNDRLNQLPEDTETWVRESLAQIAVVETQINCAPKRLTAMQVGDIKLNNDELRALVCEKKRIAKDIAVHLDIPYIAKGGSSVSVCV